MVSQDRKIAIIGGHSAIARRLRSGPCHGATAFVRRPEQASERVVEDYGDVGGRDLEGFDVVINCAGISRGTVDELDRANVRLPRNLAAACRSAEVRLLIHISSFSVYGYAEAIDMFSEPSPVSAYGRSKIRGDEAMSSAAGSLNTIAVRLPAVIEPLALRGRMAKLVDAWCRIGAVPAPKGDISRSMISAAMAANVLARLAVEGGAPVVLAGDRDPFTYARAATAISEGARRAMRVIWLQKWAFAPLRSWVPSFGYSMFADSVLDPGSNAARDEPSDMYHSLTALAARATG